MLPVMGGILVPMVLALLLNGKMVLLIINIFILLIYIVYIYILHLYIIDHWPGERFKNTYELLNLRALKFSPFNEKHLFQCIGKIFCVEFQRVPLKFHTKYLTHTLKDTVFMQHWNKSSYMFLKCPPVQFLPGHWWSDDREPDWGYLTVGYFDARIITWWETHTFIWDESIIAY